MRNLLLSASLLLGACNSAAWGGGGDTNEGSSRTYSVDAFTGVNLAGPYDVVVTQGPSVLVRAEGDSRALDRLDIRVRNGELWIGTKRRSSLSFSNPRPNATIYVTAPTLDRATLSGSGDMSLDKIGGESFQAMLSGSGDLKLGTLQVRKGDFSIAGSGDLIVAGVSDHSSLSIAGSGDIDAARLTSRTASVMIAGSGNVSTHASESASVSLMGSGDVTISGTDKCTVHKLGSGSVKCHA
jgi:hypothetical protein